MAPEQKLPTWGPQENKVCKICPLRNDTVFDVSYAMGEFQDEGVEYCNKELGSSENWTDDGLPNPPSSYEGPWIDKASTT